jgi:glycosyltransferase involved in cell wall biosynthesis
MTASVSIVLPYRDAEDTLEECIHSIHTQELKDWELLAVNDNSLDGSQSLISSFAAQDHRIKPIQSAQEGLVSALNLGVKHSSSSLIARMDADDRILPERLSSQVDFMDRNPETGLVSCKVEHYSPLANDTRGYAKYVQWTNEQLSHEQISLNRFVESPLAHPSVLFRKKLFDQYGGYGDGEYPEDYELWLRFLSAGVQMNKLDQVLLQWRDHPSRLSRQSERYSKDAFQRTKARYLRSWLVENIRPGIEIKAWGAGKVARKQAEHLARNGLEIEEFFDVDPRKIGNPRPGLKVFPVEDIPEPGKIFLLILAGARSARGKITRFLEEKEYCLGTDYLFVA